jgi:hypothetical protein
MRALSSVSWEGLHTAEKLSINRGKGILIREETDLNLVDAWLEVAKMKKAQAGHVGARDKILVVDRYFARLHLSGTSFLHLLCGFLP